MEIYSIKHAEERNLDEIVRIYNSNVSFLINHLGVKEVDNTFMSSELLETEQSGFISTLLFEGDMVIGLCDYRPGEEVYLSLFMIDGSKKGKGLGKSVYHFLEDCFKSEGAKYIRIDVVDDYEGNVLGFWEKLGFVKEDRVKLCWNGKESKALVMRKRI